MAKPMNMKRRLKQRTEITPRDPVALAMALRTGSGQGRHPDKKKRASKKACRGKVTW
jgi:hypothetical protein